MAPKKKQQGTPVPKERTQTVRQEIIAVIKEEALSIGDLSRLIGKSEKEIAEQLSHIGKSVNLKIQPAECLNCGFVFKGRKRTTKPGKCPQCKQSRIIDPLFSIR